jgi:hypothetical protein
VSSTKFDPVSFASGFKDTVTLVKGPTGQPMVIFAAQAGICYPLRSEKVLRALRSHAKQRQQHLNSNRVDAVLDELDAYAYEEGETVTTHYRVAPYPNGYVYNMGGMNFLTAAEGQIRFESVAPPGVFFIETNCMLSMPQPEFLLDVKDLLGWFNCCDDAQKLLLLAWLTYTVATPKAARLPYPILAIKAPAGSGKTFMCSKVIRQLVDPSPVPSQAMPKTVKDIAISAQHNHVLIYDNLRLVRSDLSDDLCLVATGGAIAGRKLYTDDQEFSLELRCALVLNGIHSFITESDLVSRCVHIHLNPIDSKSRQSEAELTARFEEMLPRLIFTLHSLAAKIITVVGSVEVHYKSRMADFSEWVAGLEMVLKLPPRVLQNAYKANVDQAKVAGVVDDSLFVALTAFAKPYSKSSPWHGTPHELLSMLETQTTINLGSDMPKSAAAMSRKLPVLLDALASNGVHVVRGRATDRYYDVWFQAKNCDDSDEPSATPVTSSVTTTENTTSSTDNTYGDCHE